MSILAFAFLTLDKKRNKCEAKHIMNIPISSELIYEPIK